MIHVTEIGQGTVSQTAERYALSLPATDDDTTYHDAQISSYDDAYRFTFQAPAALTLTAHAPGPLSGTAGFGFWNHPFSPDTRRLRLPKAAWFFYGAPPNNMPLAQDVPGHGWKCATLDAANPAFLALAPTAPLGFLLMRVRPLYRTLWPLGQRAIKAREHHLGDAIPPEPHIYTIRWEQNGVTFEIDGTPVYESPLSPNGRLGFIAWVDNQYAVVTPQGRFQFGTVAVPQPNTLVIDALTLSSSRAEEASPQPGRVK